MNGYLKIIILSFFLYSNTYSEQNDKCYLLFCKYGIDDNIKKPNGWVRVLNNDRIQLYTRTILTSRDKELLLRCVESENDIKFSRSFETVNIGDK